MANKSCIFCTIIKDPNNLIFEDVNTAAFMDINPVANGHILVIPKKHFANFIETPPKLACEVTMIVHKIANLLIKTIPEIKGFNILTNNGSEAFQEVFHYHVHIIPKYIREKGFLINRTKENVTIDNIINLKKILKSQLM
ncbi:HIT domain-containing protein [Spiroplasma endosymbiont of Polydrusus pterygomalis]|uniref:HIT domain-containing protein n=1 Tax=Spiroplasma endosymbiont of Polydrusus pterygomalis TaxID=3139327 RepID=UPI003CCA7BDD